MEFGDILAGEAGGSLEENRKPAIDKGSSRIEKA